MKKQFALRGWFGFLILMALAFSVTGLAQEEADKPVARAEEWWQARHGSFNERVKQGNVDLIFIGDSITQGWEGEGKTVWEKFYGKRNAVNLGISGDRTQHVLWRLDNGNIDGISPRLAVIMIGTNNASQNTVEEIAGGVRLIVEKLRAKLPEMKILLLAVFPREEKPGELRAKLTEVNKKVAALDDGSNVFFMDIGEIFTEDDGSLPKAIMPDFLHLSVDGYRLWAEAIEQKVAQLLGK